MAMGASVPLANATPITIPSGLAPGSTYFLTFVTADTHDALSSDISTYDAFVTAEADLDSTLAGLGTTWQVIGSTATVDAITHVAVTAPVYNLSGQVIARGASDMFDGTVEAAIEFSQFGTDLQAGHLRVWTGTDENGAADPSGQLGTAQGMVGFGDQDFAWLECGGLSFPDSCGQTPFGGITDHAVENHFYGISGPLTVPVPEASTGSLTLSVFLLLGGIHRRRQHRTSTPKLHAAECQA
jgi:hypothetical protein